MHSDGAGKILVFPSGKRSVASQLVPGTPNVEHSTTALSRGLQPRVGATARNKIRDRLDRSRDGGCVMCSLGGPRSSALLHENPANVLMCKLAMLSPPPRLR